MFQGFLFSLGEERLLQPAGPTEAPAAATNYILYVYCMWTDRRLNSHPFPFLFLTSADVPTGYLRSGMGEKPVRQTPEAFTKEDDDVVYYGCSY